MADTPGDPGEQSAADASQSAAIGAATDDTGMNFGSHDQGHNTQGLATPSDRGFFGGIMDAITENPVASGLQALGLFNPAFGLMGLAARVGKAYGDPNSVGPVGPGPEGDGPEPAQVQQIVPPAFNPIEDMVGSEYVAYSGVGADQLRKQLFPYMNFNQPTQPGVTGLMGQYAGVGQGTGLMTGPFGMSNTQV